MKDFTHQSMCISSKSMPPEKKTEQYLTTYEDYFVHLHHSRVIGCSEDELIQQFKASWPILNSLWMSESNLARFQNRKPSQLAVWKKMHSDHFLEFLYFVRLVQVMVSTPANTSPLERSFTKLQLVAAKRRNHFTPTNLETLFLLAAINHLCLPRGRKIC